MNAAVSSSELLESALAALDAAPPVTSEEAFRRATLKGAWISRVNQMRRMRSGLRKGMFFFFVVEAVPALLLCAAFPTLSGEILKLALFLQGFIVVAHLAFFLSFRQALRRLESLAEA